MGAGLPQLRAMVADFYNQWYGLQLTERNVLITTGCCQAMLMALTAAIQPDREVIVIEPFFALTHIVGVAGAIPRSITTHAANGYQVDSQEVIDAMNERTDTTILNSPDNTTADR